MADTLEKLWHYLHSYSWTETAGGKAATLKPNRMPTYNREVCSVTLVGGGKPTEKPAAQCIQSPSRLHNEDATPASEPSNTSMSKALAPNQVLLLSVPARYLQNLPHSLKIGGILLEAFQN